MKTIPSKLTENVTSAPVGFGDWLGSVVRGRAEWLDLLHKCQNGDATCLFVLKEMEVEMERENDKHLAMLRACRAKFGDAAVNEAIFDNGWQSLRAKR